MSNTFDNINNKYIQSLGLPDTEFCSIIQEIISDIEALPINEQDRYSKLYQDIGEAIFEREVYVVNYDLKHFKSNIKEHNIKTSDKKESKQFLAAREKSKEIKVNKFIECIHSHSNKLRRYIIIKLFNKYDNDDLKCGLVYENKQDGIYKQIKKELNDDCNIFDLKEFYSAIGAKENNNVCWMVIIIFSTHSRHEDGPLICDVLLNEFEKWFTDIEEIIVNNKDGKVSYNIENDRNEIKKEIQYLSYIDIDNEELNPDEEKILKKLFKEDYCDSLEYLKLGGGFSESKVFKIQPYKSNKPVCKYVVKINSNKSKIEKEKDNFNKYVKSIDIAYTIEPEKTENHAAIKYNFASSDSYIASKSLSECIKTSGIQELRNYIVTLFGMNLLKAWDNDIQMRTELIKDIYEEYINLESIVKTIATIEGKTIEEVKISELIHDFIKIKDHKLKMSIKPCHGDLHSENIFIDEKEKIFLIDFGFTGKHHSVIDHAALESSIKYKHIPRYIEIRKLIEIEEELLTGDTFEKDYNYKNIKRTDILKYFQLINQIRLLANTYIVDKNTKIDYYVSLFMITFRQIKYPDLNQLYALESSKLLAKKIVDVLKL